nr:carbohydrate ABC transporter permease [bacterium]
MLPGATSIIVTVFLFALVWQWNDNYMASFLQVEGKMTLALTLTSLPSMLAKLTANGAEDHLRDEYGVNASNPYTMVSMIQAGCLLMIAPLLVIYVVLQRYFTESISRSGIVG